MGNVGVRGVFARSLVYCLRNVRDMAFIRSRRNAGFSNANGCIDGKNHSIDIRAKKNEGAWMLIFHDDCLGFDPTKYLISTDKSESHTGIRLVSGLVSEMTYTNELGINNLFIQMNDD